MEHQILFGIFIGFGLGILLFIVLDILNDWFKDRRWLKGQHWPKPTHNKGKEKQ